MKPKRITAFLLSVAMILSLVPTFSLTAFADEAQGENDISGIVATNEASPPYTIEEVKEMIDNLPEASELEYMDNDELSEVHEKAQDAYDAFEALTDEQQDELTAELAKLRDVLEYMTGQTMNAAASATNSPYTLTITSYQCGLNLINNYNVTDVNFSVSLQANNQLKISFRMKHEGITNFGNTTEVAVSNTACTQPLSADFVYHVDQGKTTECKITGTLTREAQSSHSGGTATCTELAVCQYCGTAYGSTNSNHSWGAWTSNGDGTHTRTCSRDSNHTETKNCSGGTATCASKAICSDCGKEYGEFDSTNHSWGGWTSNGNGTHTRTCSHSSSHTETVNCSGGTATCTEQAVCEVCNGKYGELDSTNHSWGKWTSNGDGTHTRSCTRNNAHTENEACSGGTATCIAKAVCTTCRAAYGETNGSNHANTQFEYEQYDNDTHKKLHNCCKEFIENESHSFGTDGVCTQCKYQCPHSKPDDFTNGICNHCKYQCPHTNMADGVCKLCGESGSIGYLFKEWSNGTLTNSWHTVTENYTTVTASTTTMTTGWYVVEGNVTVPSRITISGTVHLLLCNGASLNASKGILLESENTLSIYSQSDDKDQMGRLTAESTTQYDAGIGAMFDWSTTLRSDGGKLNIYGGHITATGGKYGAGIGGSGRGDIGTITIYGGIVTATGGEYGAGIGSGDVIITNDYGKGSITLYSGVVTATGINGGAGIGGGNSGNGVTVVITGGNVKAVGNSGGAAIGAGVKGKTGGSLKNTDSQDLSLVTLTLDGAKSQTAIREIAGVTYGVQGVYTLDTNKLYVYLPSGSSVTSVTAENGQVFEPRSSGDTTLYCTHAQKADDVCSFCGAYLKASEPAKENEVYLISALDELVWFANYVNRGNSAANAKLTANIDAAVATTLGIGTSSTPYAGTFDGNNCTLNVKLNGSNYVALFPYVNGATIKNLTIQGNITASDKFAASLVGQSTGNVTIEKCISEVVITSTKSGDGTHGGLVANVSSGTLIIENCGFTGAINGSDTTSCGGFVGYSTGTTNISNSFLAATFTVNGGNTFSRGKNITVTNCYYLNALGTTNSGAIQKSADKFANGEVASLLNNGVTDGTQVWYQTIDTDTTPKFSGGTVYKTVPCVTYTNTQPVGENSHAFAENGICKKCGKGQPAELKDSVYEISNVGQLFWFADYVNEGNYGVNGKLMADLDLTGYTWTPIAYLAMSDSATVGYTGTFDGNRHVISNVKVVIPTSATANGLLGIITTGTVKNLGIDGLTFDNNDHDHRAGGIAGQLMSGGTIENCYVVNSTIKASSRVVGGIVGLCKGTVKNCYTANLTLAGANNRFGGITGDYSDGSIINCYTGYAALGSTASSIGTKDDLSQAGVSNDVFASGEIAYLLNGSKSDGVWKQTIGKDNYPNFTGLTVCNSDGKYFNNNIIVTITGVTAESGTFNGSSHKGYTGTPTADGYTGTYEVKYTGRNDTTYSSTKAPTNAGDYTVTISTDSSDTKFSGSVSLDFTISPKTVTATIEDIPDQTYTGAEIKPTITAYDETTEIPSSEYEVVYSDNINAGTATVELNNNANGNYTVSGSTTFKILPKSIDDGATVGTFAEITYSGDEQTPNATVTIDGLTATGVWSKVKYVGDTTTFTVNGNFTGTIENQSTGMKPLPVEIRWNNTEELVFNNTEKTISAEVSNRKDGDVINLTVSGDTKATNKGTYTATVTKVDNENYTVTGGKNLEKVWSIAQATDNEITDFTIKGWTYGDTAKTPTATAKYGTATFTYSTEQNGTYTDTVPTSAGTYWVKATVAETDNYAAVSSEPIWFTIAKANSETTIDDENTTVTYGETLTLTATVGKSKTKAVENDKVEFYLVDGESETLLGTADVAYADENKKDAGTATLTINTTDKKLKIGDNTITAQYGGSVNLNGSDKDTITVKLEKKEIGLSWAGYESLVFDENPKSVTATATGIESGDGEIGVTVTGGTERNAGTHTATATALTGTNAIYYKLPEEATQAYTISPKTVTAQISTISDQTYTGSAITPTITAYDGETEIPPTEYEVKYSKNTNKGTATVELKNKANGNYTVSGSTTFEILPKSIDGATVGTFVEMTYNGDEQTPTATVTIDNLTATGVWSDVKYVGDTTTFTANDNFTGEITNQSTGMKPLPVIIGWKNTEGLVFDNTEKTISAEVSNKKDGDDINLTITGDLTGTNKGTYTATVTAVGNENYTIENGENLKKEWVISQANDNVITDLAIVGWTYGDTANTPTATATYGTPTFTYSTEENGGYTDTVPTNAGTYWVKATVAGTDDYAEVSSDPIPFTIAKAESSVTTEPTKAENLVYTGEELALITADGAAEGGTIKYSVDGENFDYDFADIPKVINAKDDYKVWYKVVGDNNHNDTTAVCIEIAVANKPINTEITLTAPVKNATPQTSIVTDEYTATVSWSPEIAEGGTFAKSTEYTATITITPKTNYTVIGIGENGYTLDGATSVANEANSDVVTAVFPKTGSSGGGSSSTRYTVKFNTNGGSTVTSQTVKKNGTITEPKEPTKDGYVFDGWYTDSKFANEYDFDTTVTKNITLYAKWVEDEAQNPSDDKKDDTNDKKDDNKNDNKDDGKDDNKPTTDNRENPFDDVKENEWYFDDVKYANENGLMTGITNSIFAPNENITRGMFVTVLYRAEGEPAVNKSIPFADVKADMYYANAVIWAEQNGIVKGVSETEYAPDENITREQIATIIYRYAQYKGIAPTGAWAIKLNYADVSDISDYAVDGVMYCTLKGIMQGKDNNMFAPKDNATRAEIAAILNRFIESNK